jgi:hypothetical protein
VKLLEILLSMSMRRSVHVLLAWSFWRYLCARMEYDENIDDPRASMTELLIAASVGLWFIGLSLGWSSAHASWSLASVVILVGEIFRKVGSCWWNWQVWSDRDGLQDGVVSGVADWRFGEYFDQGIQSGQVDVPSALVPVETL